MKATEAKRKLRELRNELIDDKQMQDILGAVDTRPKNRYIAKCNLSCLEYRRQQYEDKGIMQAIFLRYKNGEVYFGGSKINAFTEEGIRQIRNLLEEGLYEIDKELENISKSK